jgi:hypothetical protein
MSYIFKKGYLYISYISIIRERILYSFYLYIDSLYIAYIVFYYTNIA